MTIREAILIQNAQLAYYRQSIGRKGIKLIRRSTSIPDDISLDIPIDISIINEMIPRGGAIEYYIKSYKHNDPTNEALYKAMIKGIL